MTKLQRTLAFMLFFFIYIYEESGMVKMALSATRQKRGLLSRTQERRPFLTSRRNVPIGPLVT